MSVKEIKTVWEFYIIEERGWQMVYLLVIAESFVIYTLIYKINTQ